MNFNKYKWLRPAISPIPPGQVEELSSSAVKVLRALQQRFEPAPAYIQPWRSDMPSVQLGEIHEDDRQKQSGLLSDSRFLRPEECSLPRFSPTTDHNPPQLHGNRGLISSASITSPPSNIQHQYDFSHPWKNKDVHEQHDSSWKELSEIGALDPTLPQEVDLIFPPSSLSTSLSIEARSDLNSSLMSILTVSESNECTDSFYHTGGLEAKSPFNDIEHSKCSERGDQSKDEFCKGPESSLGRETEFTSYFTVNDVTTSSDDENLSFGDVIPKSQERKGKLIESPLHIDKQDFSFLDTVNRGEQAISFSGDTAQSSASILADSESSYTLNRNYISFEQLTPPICEPPNIIEVVGMQGSISSDFSFEDSFEENNPQKTSSKEHSMSPKASCNQPSTRLVTSVGKKRKFLGTPFKRALSSSSISAKEISAEATTQNSKDAPKSDVANKENYKPQLEMSNQDKTESSHITETHTNASKAINHNEIIVSPLAQTSAHKTPTNSKAYFAMFDTNVRTKQKFSDGHSKQSSTHFGTCKKKPKFTVPFMRKEEIESPSAHKKIQELGAKLAKEVGKKTIIQQLNEKRAQEISEKLAQSPPQETTLTVQYKGGFCQLNRTKVYETHMPDNVLLRVVWSSNVQYLSLPLRREAWLSSFLKTVFSEKTRKICFQAQEMIQILIDMFGFNVNEVSSHWLILDPLVGCWLLNPDKPPHSFKEVLTFLKLPEDCNGPVEMLCKLSHCAEVLYENLTKNGLWKVFLHVEMRITPILACMELNGIQVDKKKVQEMAKLLTSRLESVQKAAHEAAGKPFLLTSPQQLSDILYNQLKLDSKINTRVKETDKCHKSTSESMLTKLKDLHPLPKLVLEFRGLHKLKSTYVDALLSHLSGNRIYTTWDQISAATGRITSIQPNLQNIPKHPLMPDLLIRTAFVAKEGFSYLSADFQHVELRVFAHLSKESTLIKVLSGDKDVFKLLSQQWLQVQNIDEVSEEERDKTKRIVYALMYGAGASKLTEFLHIDYSQACSIVQKFSGAFPKMQEFAKSTIDKCRKQGYLATETGRRRWFPNITSSNFQQRTHSERQAVNFLIQGTAADLCKCAMVHTQKLVSAISTNKSIPTAQLILQLHDELLWEVPDFDLLQVTDVVQKAMERAPSVLQSFSNFSVPLPVEMKVGKNWGEMETVNKVSLGHSQQI